jgi:hypothetical protein
MLRSLVRRHLEAYASAHSKDERSSILLLILKHIEKCNDGRISFVKLDSSGRWWTVSRINERATVSQAFRNALGHRHRSSKQTKRLRRLFQRTKGSLTGGSNEDTDDGIPSIVSSSMSSSSSCLESSSSLSSSSSPTTVLSMLQEQFLQEAQDARKRVQSGFDETASSCNSQELVSEIVDPIRFGSSSETDPFEHIPFPEALQQDLNQHQSRVPENSSARVLQHRLVSRSPYEEESHNDDVFGIFHDLPLSYVPLALD